MSTEFQLTIVRRITDPEYMQKMVEWQKEHRHRNGYYGSPDAVPDQPRAWADESVLTVTVNEATFEAIRKAALETL